MEPKVLNVRNTGLMRLLNSPSQDTLFIFLSEKSNPLVQPHINSHSFCTNSHTVLSKDLIFRLKSKVGGSVCS